MRGNLPVFCPTPKAIYFFRKGWTGRNSLRSQEKLVSWRRPQDRNKINGKTGDLWGERALSPHGRFVTSAPLIRPVLRPGDTFALVAELVDALP
jgi:hypothetical protein